VRQSVRIMPAMAGNMRPGFLPGLVIGLLAGVILAMALDLLPDVSGLRAQNRALTIKLQNLERESSGQKRSPGAPEQASQQDDRTRGPIVILELDRSPSFLFMQPSEGGPIAVLWDDGTMLRCRSDGEIGTHYVKGRVDPQPAKQLEAELYHLATTTRMSPGEAAGMDRQFESLRLRSAYLDWRTPFREDGWQASIHKRLLEAPLNGSQEIEAQLVMDGWRKGKLAVGRGSFP
jgi:hypothetical protein